MIELTRRQWIAGAGAAAAGTLALNPARLASATALPTPWLVNIAKRELQKHGAAVRYHDRVAIADYTLPSRDPRFFFVDLQSGTVTSHLVTHGRGSDPDHVGWLKYFSNVNGSLASSRGAYVTGDQYYGSNGLSLRLKGMDTDNYNAEPRAIVVHGAWYANPKMIAEQGKLGRSEGCFAFPEAELANVLDRLGAGRLIFADRL